MTGSASIQRRVLLSALAALALGAVLLVGGSWWLLRNEMAEVFEDNLKQVALAVATDHRSGSTLRAPRFTQRLPRIYEEHGAFEFVVVVWSPDGKRLHASDESVNLPFLKRSGLSTVDEGGRTWHVYTIVLEDGVVQAAQQANERELLARETASHLILPALLILALTAGLLALALRRGLSPLPQAAREVTARNVQSLAPIPLETQPVELQGLVGAINGLMARLGNALALQRHFVADAAHELRTPIAALRLQLQLLQRANDEPQRLEAMKELEAGIARAQHLVEQLLQLSRLGPEAPPLQRAEIRLGELAREVVGRFSAQAEQRGIDLGADVRAAAVVGGDGHQLGILLGNLVDNALRHTPGGGRVDVGAFVEGGRPVLRVTDTGPGIPRAERARVFDRFYRSSQAAAGGSGLGLAIVKAIADRHAASIALGDGPGGAGLSVTVSFPPA